MLIPTKFPLSHCLCFVSQISECKEKKHIMIVLILRFLLLLPTVKASMHDVACLCKKRQSISEINHSNV